MLHLLLNAKRQGFDVASVSVGACKVELRKPPAAPEQQADQPARPSAYERMLEHFGGDLYRRSRGTNGRAAPQTVAGEEYQPAIEAEG